MSDIALVHATFGNAGEAETIGRTMVEERLAACVNLIPDTRSIYLWQGKVEESQECQMTIKTRASLFAPLRRFIRQHHPYEIPEIIALPVADIDDDYLAWLQEVTDVSEVI